MVSIVFWKGSQKSLYIPNVTKQKQRIQICISCYDLEFELDYYAMLYKFHPPSLW